MNPILDALSPQGQPLNNVRQMYQAYQAAANPNEFLQQMMQRNPILAQIANNGNLEQTFYQMCQQRGVNPQDILNGIQR